MRALMNRMMIMAGLALAIVTAAHADVVTLPSYTLQAPKNAFVVAFPQENWVVNEVRQRDDGNGVYAQFTNSKTQVVVSFFIDPADSCKTSEQCRDAFWQNPGPAYAHAMGVERLTLNSFAVLKCIVPFDATHPTDTSSQQLNYSAHLVKNGYWLNVHASKLPFAAADEPVVTRFLQSIQVE